ncbi:hypothetical protein SCACP_23280 [Sporomusa carbonis]|uniref:hypothetical protein n=1 Tax=Sporomusa carbonis TaxID=3076075 RepID=UPI003A67D73E
MNWRHESILDGTTFEFPRTGFWIIHVFGGLFLMLLGMRTAVRRAPLPIVAYRLLKMLRQ